MGGATRINKAAVFLKVEGDYDDGAREKARAALEAEVAALGLAGRCQMLVAVGCEGVATPFGYLLAERNVDASLSSNTAARLVMGFASGRPLAAAELDALTLADRVDETVRDALLDANLHPDQVAMCFVKIPAVPVQPGDRVRGRRARAIAALGAGVALGEIDRARLTDAVIAKDSSVYARRVQNFAGAEVKSVEAIVLGNRPGVGGDLIAMSGLLADMIDAPGLARILERGPECEVRALFLKAGVPADGNVRGARTTIFSSGWPPEKSMRAALSGLVGAVTGDTRAFITGDPIQAAPEGGGSACAILRMKA